MDWSQILSSEKYPEPFFEGDGPFWADPYISSHVVLAHLDQASDDASRPFDQIQEEVRWIDSHFAHPGRCLDLGCGPGFYSLELAKKGWQTTGFDLSPASITFAQDEAADLKLRADFHHGDFLRLPFPPNLDLIVLVYGIFGTLSPANVKKLLQKCAQALAPGGLLIFDTFGFYWWNREKEKEKDIHWEVHGPGGFWSPCPHLALSRSYVYPEERVFGRLYTIIDDRGIKCFPFWYRWYTPELMNKEFFSDWDLSFFPSLRGTEGKKDSDWFAVVARKKEADHAAQQSF